MGIFQGKLVIGVIGTHRGAGVTHFCLMLAGYASWYLGCKTAYIECHPQNEIRCLQEIREEDMDAHQDSFVLHKVTYYKSVSNKRIGEIIGDRYDCVILDLGSDFTNGKSEFERCDRKFIISSMALWKRQELDKFIKHTVHLRQSDQWIYAVPFAGNSDLKIIAKELGRKIQGIPNQPDPYALSATAIQFFQQILK
ncbi:MAG: hypothetical protein K0R21_1005 [Anaerocolumna sp.]|jgi:hypothetical protein|nr:hypothetical protein [Anaerocolumna sp.]